MSILRHIKGHDLDKALLKQNPRRYFFLMEQRKTESINQIAGQSGTMHFKCN